MKSCNIKERLAFSEVPALPIHWPAIQSRSSQVAIKFWNWAYTEGTNANMKLQAQLNVILLSRNSEQWKRENPWRTRYQLLTRATKTQTKKTLINSRPFRRSAVKKEHSQIVGFYVTEKYKTNQPSSKRAQPIVTSRTFSLRKDRGKIKQSIGTLRIQKHLNCSLLFVPLFVSTSDWAKLRRFGFEMIRTVPKLFGRCFGYFEGSAVSSLSSQHGAVSFGFVGVAGPGFPQREGNLPRSYDSMLRLAVFADP